MSADGSARKRSVVAGVVVAEFFSDRKISYEEMISTTPRTTRQFPTTVASVTIEVNGNAISMTPAKVVQPLSIASESLIP
jgi:hypothetical protein